MELRHRIEAAHARISGEVRRTPVEASPLLAGSGGGRAWLKLENTQLTGSFKLRGATNKILSLERDQLSQGVVAASSGNHGAAVACAAAAAGCPAIVYVPDSAAASKVAAIRSWGAEVRPLGGDALLSEIEARRYADSEGMTYVSPYNDLEVVAGQGTLGVELAEQLDSLDAVFLALGGGGLAAGVGGYLKALVPEVEIVACSPANSAVLHASLEAGRILEMESLPTLSDGTAGGVEAGAVTFELCREVIDETVLVEEAEIGTALRTVIGSHHTLIEGAAGVAMAGYLARRGQFADKNVAIVLCGANIDPGVLARVLREDSASG